MTTAFPSLSWKAGFLAALATIPPPTTATSTTSTSKRGLAYLGDTHTGDDELLYSANSSLAWYYNWSPNAITTIPSSLPFVPLLHGLADASSSTLQSTLGALPSTSTHLLTFNEPDGTTDSGGSAISPSDAAQAYIDDIVPLRTDSSREWLISHPATTGSDSGLSWLREFNASCWEIDAENGCPLDFVALHWYGDFAGLASWLGTLYEFYVTNGTSSSSSSSSQNLTFWITEMALPQASADETLAMMNQSLSYLDSLSYVEAYAWYGTDRKSSSWDGYTGGNVAVFTSGGALTDVGALYLGGEKDGFKAGMKGAAGRGFGVSWAAAVLATVGFALSMS
ncbi:glycosyl hydrolase catalytic core-domain-containing protein [Coniella lustricola]|uniref:Glycosyl hydrolase catalytic core-domain-containing protein n=1 Tax=Coniella lustricola TaxID=2025994 RepID=A0A2T3A121_9PEZI|nr:glycosyl hydrolase catalytic core-domain-containing protein [Coniella lustricola]